MQATDNTPAGPTAFGVIAERFRRAGQPDKAVSLCREGLEKFPEHLSARVTLGWSLLDMGEHQEAFDQLKRVLKRAPDNLAAIRGLAELHERGIGLVFDSLSEPEPELDPEFGPELEPELDPVVVAADVSPAPELEADALNTLSPEFEIEDVMDEELSDAFDLSGFLDAPRLPAAALEEPVTESRPVSMFERAPLALRDDADLERVGELHDWLSRIRDRRSDSVSQYVAG